MKVNYLLALYFLSFGLNQTFAQTFRYNYQINPIKTAAWYKICLDDQLRANSKSDLSDIRLFDGKDTIPYFLKESVAAENSEQLKVFKGHFQSPHQYLVQTDKSKVGYLQLKVSNHKNPRKFKVLGSYNMQKWFPISDQEFLHGSPNNDALFYWQDLNLPNVDYAYLQFYFTDSALEIPYISAVIAPFQTQNEMSYQVVSGVKYAVVADNAGKSTLIKLFSNKPQWIHQISFAITEPDFYQRNLSVYRQVVANLKRGKIRVTKEFLASFTLKSEQASQLFLPHYLKDTLYLEIANEDNIPLKIADLTCLQRKVFLYANLQEGKSYSIFCGNALAPKPNYDIENFAARVNDKKTINASYQFAQEIEQIELPKEAKHFFEKPIFLWLSLGFAALILIYFTLKLLKENSTKS